MSPAPNDDLKAVSGANWFLHEICLLLRIKCRSQVSLFSPSTLKCVKYMGHSDEHEDQYGTHWRFGDESWKRKKL